MARNKATSFLWFGAVGGAGVGRRTPCKPRTASVTGRGENAPPRSLPRPLRALRGEGSPPLSRRRGWLLGLGQGGPYLRPELAPWLPLTLRQGFQRLRLTHPGQLREVEPVGQPLGRGLAFA